MPKVRPGRFARFGRGTATSIRPAVPFILKAGAVAGGAAAFGIAGGHLAQKVGNAFHPPLQREDLDPNPGQTGDESSVVYDPITGRLVVFGMPSAEQSAPDRTIKSGVQWGIVAAAVVAGLGLFLLAGRKGGGK